MGLLTPRLLGADPTETQLLDPVLSGASAVEDALAALSDDFNGSDSLTDRGWTIYNSGTIADQTISGGEVHLSSTTGGSAGAWWYSQISPALNENGAIVYKLITGDFDVRARVRVRNAANTGSPAGGAPLEWRFAGIQAQDPAGLTAGTAFNYIHIGLGGDPNGQNRIEWKVTDSGGATTPQSTFASDAGSAPLDYDLRMVRSTQTFGLFYRRTDSGLALASDASWTQVAIGDIIKNANTPARTGSATPVAFPDTLAVGLMPPYAGPTTTLDCQSWTEQVLVRSAS